MLLHVTCVTRCMGSYCTFLALYGDRDRIPFLWDLCQELRNFAFHMLIYTVQWCSECRMPQNAFRRMVLLKWSLGCNSHTIVMSIVVHVKVLSLEASVQQSSLVRKKNRRSGCRQAKMVSLERVMWQSQEKIVMRWSAVVTIRYQPKSSLKQL